jgi:hypothetical protein
VLEAPGRQSATLEVTAHRRWPLPEGSWLMGQTWAIEENTMQAAGVELVDGKPLLHFSARQDVVIWPLADA